MWPVCAPPVCGQCVHRQALSYLLHFPRVTITDDLRAPPVCGRCNRVPAHAVLGPREHTTWPDGCFPSFSCSAQVDITYTFGSPDTGAAAQADGSFAYGLTLEDVSHDSRDTVCTCHSACLQLSAASAHSAIMLVIREPCSACMSPTCLWRPCKRSDCVSARYGNVAAVAQAIVTWCT